MASSDTRRVSVTLIDVAAPNEAEFAAIATQFEALLLRKHYGRAEILADEAVERRFYWVAFWHSVDMADQYHADEEAQALTARLYQIARVTNVVNGARRPDPERRLLDDRRTHVEADRRAGFDRRHRNIGSPTSTERRGGRDRRLGPRRLRNRPGEIDLVAAARRAREYADAAFSNFKVGAALETADGDVITGCNVENATYGLTICAERVAMFKALSEGHRAFIRIAIVADTESPTPPCGACRQILWEFGGNLEILLANLERERGTHQLKDLLPLPFDARLL